MHFQFEQITFVVRYAYINLLEFGIECIIIELFLGFLPIGGSTGKEFSEVLLGEFGENGLKVENERSRLQQCFKYERQYIRSMINN